MVTEQPNVQPNSRYTVTETCKLLGIHRNSLLKYTKSGRIKSGVRKSTAKKFYLGSEIISFWNKQI
ncbi:helix-turn-helix domain-containing protein [Bacteroides caecimuris]|uniref:helix-turn-helix domain-containing protein n=1 Tax=Bacteroides caecimuris TaxID=1796613 RepID=UPI000FFF114E|nr:helix-turn-helix domain-containing protein [Bacteroides caecimuris]MCM1033016.1 helix-turn-helix domain-containing protein [Odoribacter sp.]RXE71131.1 DNA-binding protein [Muribaculaceae bacterium Isolate-002 (NCI)]